MFNISLKRYLFHHNVTKYDLGLGRKRAESYEGSWTIFSFSTYWVFLHECWSEFGVGLWEISELKPTDGS